MLKSKKGVSLIVLLITIIVIIILASVIILNFDNNNPIDRANEAKFKSDLASFKEQLLITHTEKAMTNPDYVKEDVNVDVGKLNQMKLYIPDITEEYANKLFIKNGKLLYINDTTSADYLEVEKSWAKTVGVNTPYTQVGDANGDGVVTIEDAEEIQKLLAHRLDYEIDDLTEEKIKIFDTNGDGRISINDVSPIHDYINGKIDSLPHTQSE